MAFTCNILSRGLIIIKFSSIRRKYLIHPPRCLFLGSCAFACPAPRAKKDQGGPCLPPQSQSCKSPLPHSLEEIPCLLFQTVISIYACLQLVMIVLWSRDSYQRSPSSIASASLNLAVSLTLALLSHLEHKRSIRPSFLITFYLFASLFFDIARVRTQWLLRSSNALAAVLTASVAFKVLMLALEATGKRRILLQSYRNISTENTSSIFNRGVFWWLNSLLLSGFKSVLSVDDLLTISETLESRRLSDKLQAGWNKCKPSPGRTHSANTNYECAAKRQHKRHALALETMISLRWETLSIMLPRFCLVALSISQPFLINHAINFLQAPENEKPDSVGYGLIGGFSFVYIGIAVSPRKIRDSLLLIMF